MVLVIIGVTHIRFLMAVKKKIKKRNPYAKDLKLPKYKQRIVGSKKTYTRKGNKKVIEHNSSRVLQRAFYNSKNQSYSDSIINLEERISYVLKTQLLN